MEITRRRLGSLAAASVGADQAGVVRAAPRSRRLDAIVLNAGVSSLNAAWLSPMANRGLEGALEPCEQVVLEIISA